MEPMDLILYAIVGIIYFLIYLPGKQIYQDYKLLRGRTFQEQRWIRKLRKHTNKLLKKSKKECFTGISPNEMNLIKQRWENRVCNISILKNVSVETAERDASCFMLDLIADMVYFGVICDWGAEVSKSSARSIIEQCCRQLNLTAEKEEQIQADILSGISLFGYL